MTRPSPTNPTLTASPETRLLAELAAADPALAVAVDRLSRWAREEPHAEAPAPSRAGRIAVVPVYGVLMPTALARLGRQVGALAADADVAAIVLHVDSPGGTVAGTAEAAAEVAAAARVKPVVAVADTLAASAAYWIASQASELAVTATGDVGSIGIIAMHMDVSKALDDLGIKATVFRSAPFKAEGSPFEALTDTAKEWMQARVDEAHGWFVQAVAAGRRTSAEKVAAEFGRGRVVSAHAAVAAGMADRVASLDQTLRDLAARIAAPAGPRRRRSSLAFA
jgi:signal peptide peptidase SppA